jgi:formamidopyrimidine-DNA glycosylase
LINNILLFFAPRVTGFVYWIVMPELPEIESIVRDLRGPLAGRTVVRAALLRRDVYRTGSRSLRSVTGSKIIDVKRFGKAIVFRLDPPSVIVVHLGMSGNLILTVGHDRPRRHKHRHAVIQASGGRRLDYVDPRRFGYVWVGSAENLGEQLRIGPDPFQIEAPVLRSRLENRSAPIKSLLLDQRLISGIGNIYADEALFRAGLHPLTPGGLAAARADSLLKAARFVLRRAIRYGGTTIRDYRRADGSNGAFQQRLAVYGRTAEPCIRCGTAIRRIVVSSRGTHYCPYCQRGGRGSVEDGGGG